MTAHSPARPHGHGHHHPDVPARIASAMLMSASARLGVAAVLAAVLWGLVAWAMS